MLCVLRFGVRAGARFSRTALVATPTFSRLRGVSIPKTSIAHIRWLSAVNGEPAVTNQYQSLDEVVEALCSGDSDLERRLRVLMLEVEVMRQDGRQAPQHLTTEHWRNLLDLSNRSQRSRYLTFLFKNEKSRENRKARQEEKKKEYESKPKPQKENPDDMEYGLQANALFLRIRDNSINNFDNYRALQAIMYGQSLVIDCSYDDKMVPREALNAAKQLTLAFGDNRVHREPFNMHLCNVKPNGKTIRQLQKNIPILYEPWFPLNVHEQSYTEIFPKKDLVYLTPHCRDELAEFDKDAVYIVGCMVDKANNEPLSLAKAKRDGIRMAKLPLDRYLEWAPGSGKCLNINHMINILLDLNLTGDWEHSLRHVPRRKLMETKIQAVQNNMSKFNPQFVNSLKINRFDSKPKFTPRLYNRGYPQSQPRSYNDRKVNIKSLFNEDNKF